MYTYITDFVYKSWNLTDYNIVWSTHNKLQTFKTQKV